MYTTIFRILLLCSLLTVGVGVRSADADTNRIAVANSHSCAITSAGALKCWGDNSRGQLGIGILGSPSPTAIPQQVTNMTSGVTYVATGYLTTCAIKSGALYCWGDNTWGQLGNGMTGATLPSWPAPVLVSTGPFASVTTKVVVGANHVCAQIDYSTPPSSTGGDLYCWGHNGYGQLGIGTIDNLTTHTTPLLVQNASTLHFRDVVAADSHTCAVGDATRTGTGAVQGMYCWGANTAGQVSQVPGNKGSPSLYDTQWIYGAYGGPPIHISVSMYYSCISDNPYGNSSCMGTAPYMNNPATAPAVAQPISATPYKMQCPINKPGCVPVPTSNWILNASGATINKIKASAFYTVGREGYQMIIGGRIKGAGTQEFCKLGNGVCTATSVNTFSATSVVKVNSTTDLVNPAELSVGALHACAMAPDLTAPFTLRPYCWGINNWGQAGNGVPNSPTQVQYATVVSGTW